ncbi:hypothetical protein EMIHUDRAFT_209463 [Emiliania huxleyi CCMP1516]|uniref:JmjC domain-containing protein n=2 Tax=Emiliania huxleyi TaxID=2903 RepID=A0A0D3J5R4_EMIH1|nr:hypothetical protein EMIHUDRAFT_209463 [Emiliania huxleyi CCMP1516]EOD18849.1 hypothetical protein EMIHUDRAFT_209463 [Emiliania huxleyi CCMP1516]|eukprot:XP_005771278.1 hypothetical protein EMIHUDRAFT_209463 [Emiliania huxleyi CCMP1516]
MYLESGVGDQDICYSNADEPVTAFKKSLPLRSFLKQLDEGTPIKHFADAFPPHEFLLNTKVALMEQVDLRALQDASFCGQGPWDWNSWPLLPPYLLASEDLRKPIDWTKAPECLKGLGGWTVDIKPGQMLFMPSTTWHWFSAEEVSFAFVLRCRSFSSVLGSLKFFWGPQSPAVLLPGYGAMWAKIPPDLRQKMIRFRFLPPALASPIFRASILILGLPVYLWLLVRFGMSYLLMSCTSSKKARFCSSKTITADKRGGAD